MVTASISRRMAAKSAAVALGWMMSSTLPEKGLLLEQRQLVGGRGIIDLDLEEKAVGLRLGQRETCPRTRSDFAWR